MPRRLGLWLWSLPLTLHGVMDQAQLNRFHTYVLAPNQLFLLAWGGLLAGLHERTEARLEPKVALLLALPLLAPAQRRPASRSHAKKALPVSPKAGAKKAVASGHIAGGQFQLRRGRPWYAMRCYTKCTRC